MTPSVIKINLFVQGTSQNMYDDENIYMYDVVRHFSVQLILQDLFQKWLMFIEFFYYPGN